MKTKTITYRSSSLKKTAAIAAKFVRVAAEKKHSRRGALVLALSGELGSGKTAFAKFFLRELGARTASSPTFVLIKEHGLSRGPYRIAYHADVYRLSRAEEIMKMGLREAMKNNDAVIIIEWANRLGSKLPKHAIHIAFSHGKKKNERIIKISGRRTTP